jgi:hypothetical protein
MAYTGTGTQNDPYVVDNWDSLIEKIADTEAYVTVADNVDIDLTKIYPEGISYTNAPPLLNFACKEFDGNGITIRNAYSLSPRTGSNAVIECATTCDALSNINFVNFYINGGDVDPVLIRGRKSSNYITIAHCTFKGVLFTSHSSTIYFWRYINRFFDCVWNVKIVASYNSSYFYNTVVFDSCWLRFDTNIHWKDYGNGRFVNTYLEGNFAAYANNTKILELGNPLVSIINATLNVGEYTGCSVYTNSNASLILINTDKFIGDIALTGYNGNVKFIGVTDTQLKDYNYLSTIFPVVPNEEGSGG